MKVNVLAVLMSLTLCLLMLGVVALSNPSPTIAVPAPVSHTWHVATTGNDTTGSGNETYPWQTIQHAIDESLSGDTIIVHPGEYEAGNLVGPSNLTIESSDGPEVTTVHGSTITGFNVTAPNAVIDGFNVTACAIGIMLENGADNATIKNNIVEYNGCGIEVNSSCNLIINNNITGNGHGVWIEAGNNRVLGNNILSNTASSGSGVHVTGDLEDVYVEFNNIVGNSPEGSDSYGVYSSSTYEDFTVGAENNWWGNATGPYDPVDNPEGTGDAANGYVDYWSWLGAPLELPVHYEELVGAGSHLVDATAEADTTVNLTLLEEDEDDPTLDIVVARYESQPFPEATFPDLSLGKFIDIGFPGGYATEYEIGWPVHVEMTYTDGELTGSGIDETTLGFYYMTFQYYDDSLVESWGRHWGHTGVDTASNTIRADLVPDDFYGGAPFGTGGLAEPRILADNIYVSDATGNDTWDGQSPTWNGTSGPKKTIQGGIDAVAIGGTVHVENGTYNVSGLYAAYVDNPNINIYSSDGPGAAIISGPGYYYGFWVDDSGVTIDGFNITGFDYGIYLSGFGWGADNCTVSDCNATDNGVNGIYLDASNCHIVSSDLTNNTGDGISLGDEAEGDTIEDCNASGNGGSGIYVNADSCNIFSSNLTNNFYFGIFLWGANGNNIEDCNATGNGLVPDDGGIWLHDSWYNTIDGCNANNNYYGIHLDGSDDNTINGCNANDNTYGIHLDSSANNLIANSTVSQNTVHGILLNSSSDNQIMGNNILSNPGTSTPSASGIHLTGRSYGNVIRFNNIVGNSPAGSDSYGVYNDNTNSHVTADNNWWGNDTGPTHSENPDGTGDAVSDYVIYTPWLGAQLVLPAVQYETLSAGTHTVNATAEADTNVTFTVLDGSQTEINIARYESQPFPQEPFPDTALGIYIDIFLSDPDAVVWPIYVEVSYTDDEVTAAGIDESTLGLYYYQSVDTFHRCSDTGVDTTNNIIWANVTQEEAGYLAGTPFAGGGLSSAAEPHAIGIPTISFWGGVALAVVFFAMLLLLVRRRLTAEGKAS